MKKLLSFIAIATCGVVLFAACESSEAVTRNLLEWQGYRYNLTNAQQFVDSPDTLFVIEDGDTLCAGFVYALALNSPGIGVDTLEDPEDHDLWYTYPTDGRKWAQVQIGLYSPGLNEICEGTYTLAGYSPDTKDVDHRIPEDMFFTCSAACVFTNYLPDSEGPSTKVITDDELPDMYYSIDKEELSNCTITIKKGMLAYDIEIKGKDRAGNPVVGCYTGFVPRTPRILNVRFWYY